MTHVTKEQIRLFIQNKMSKEDEAVFLEHISYCEYCASQLANALQLAELIETPPDLKQQILDETVYKKSALETVKQLEERRRQKRREFYTFTAKIVFAMCAVMVMLFSTGGMSSKLPSDYLGTDSEFSKQIKEQQKKEAKNRKIKSQSRILDSVGKSSEKMQQYFGFMFQTGQNDYAENKKEEE